MGTRTLAAVVLGSTHWREPSWRPPLLTKTCPRPTACRLQCWDASGQTTNRAGTQPYPSADRLLEVFLSIQLPDKHPLIWPCPPEEQTRLHPLVDRNQSFPPGGRQQKHEEIQPCRMETAIRKLVRQNETAEEYVPEEGTR